MQRIVLHALVILNLLSFSCVAFGTSYGAFDLGIGITTNPIGKSEHSFESSMSLELGVILLNEASPCPQRKGSDKYLKIRPTKIGISHVDNALTITITPLSIQIADSIYFGSSFYIGKKSFQALTLSMQVFQIEI